MEKESQKDNRIEFKIKKIFIKDISFSIPEGSKIFKEKWEPKLELSVNTKSSDLDEDLFEVILCVKANVKCGDFYAFKSEVHQAGQFLVKNMNIKQLNHTKYAFFPGLLYPYARATISDLVIKGGFPQLCTSPINFDLLYEQEFKNKEIKS